MSRRRWTPASGAANCVRCVRIAYEKALDGYVRSIREPPTIAFSPSPKRTQALPLPS
jgi:hypothetical protein